MAKFRVASIAAPDGPERNLVIFKSVAPDEPDELIAEGFASESEAEEVAARLNRNAAEIEELRAQSKLEAGW